MVSAGISCLTVTCFICLSVWDPWPLNFGAFLKLFRWPGHASALPWLPIAFYSHSLYSLPCLSVSPFLLSFVFATFLPLIILVLATFSLPLLGWQPLPLCLPLPLCCCFCCCPPDQPVLLRMMMIKTRQEKVIHKNSFDWSAWCWPPGETLEGLKSEPNCMLTSSEGWQSGKVFFKQSRTSCT